MSVKSTVASTVETACGRSIPASSRMISITASRWSPERPGSTCTVALGMREATYSASSTSAVASPSPMTSAVGACTLGRMSRTSVCHRICVSASRDVGTHRVPGDSRVAPHELLINRERVPFAVRDPGALGGAGERQVAGVVGRAPARCLRESRLESVRPLPPRVVGSPCEPRARVVPDEPGRPVGIGRREQRVHRAGGRCRTEHRRLGTDLVEHGEQVGGAGLEVRRWNVARRGTASATVVEDEARELGEADEQRTPVRLVPDQVDVAREGVEVHRDVHRHPTRRPDTRCRRRRPSLRIASRESPCHRWPTLTNWNPSTQFIARARRSSDIPHTRAAGAPLSRQAIGCVVTMSPKRPPEPS